MYRRVILLNLKILKDVPYTQRRARGAGGGALRLANRGYLKSHYPPRGVFFFFARR